jgi:hypothetical protein
MARNMNQYVTSSWYKAEDIEPGVKIEEVVSLVDETTFEGDEYPTPYLAFTTGKKVTLNQTRLGVMIRGFGPIDENWLGKTILVSRGEAPFGGKIVPAVKIEAVVPERLGSAPQKPRLFSTNNFNPPAAPPEKYDGPTSGGTEGDLSDEIPF